jgi:hypothetical protein
VREVEVSERQPLQWAKNQTKRQGQEKAVSRNQFSTTSGSELVLGPKVDHCQWMSVTVADDVETIEPTIEKKRVSQMRRNDIGQPSM